MKSVLISIKPKWCELIAQGKKTVEVRKTKPKTDVPFKCYIYCTKAKYIYSIGGGLYDYKDNLYRLPTGEIKFGDGFELMGDWRGQYDETNFLNGKVIGEFVCKGIMRPIDNLNLLSRLSCLSKDELYEYSNGKQFYGWRITDLVIYDKPRELGEFRSYNAKLGIDENGYLMPTHEITRPPQSWCYVEELGV